jgi:hypothetical protein
VEVVQSNRRIWLSAAAMFLGALLWQFFTYNGFPNDHYYHVARARQMLLGEWPVRDFVDVGAPLTYVISAAPRSLFGDRAASELLVVALGVAVGAAATTIGASWLARSTVIGVGVGVLEILASPRSYSYPKMLLYGLAGCMIVALAAQATRARLLIAAGLTAVSFLMRHDHGLFIGTACALAMVLGATSVADAARRLAVFGAGTAVLLLPWAIWVQYYQGLVPYFEMGIAVSRREADISLLRDLPQLRIAAGLTAANVLAWMYYLYWTIAGLCMVLALARRVLRREQWRGESVAVGAIALVGLALDSSFLRNPLETRLADAVVPACLLGAWLLGLVWTMQAHRAIVIALRVASSVVLALTIVAIWGIGDVHDKLDEVGVFADDLEHFQQHTAAVVNALAQPEVDVRKLPSRVSAALVPFLRYVDRCTAPTDRLLVSGPYPDVFVLGRRGFAGGHITFTQGFYHSEADQELTLARMKRQSVPFVVLPLDDQPAFEDGFRHVHAHIAAAYEPLADVQADGLKGIRIMVDRARTPHGTDSETGWPCFVRRDGST